MQKSTTLASTGMGPEVGTTAIDVNLFKKIGLFGLLWQSKSGVTKWLRLAVRVICWMVIGMELGQLLKTLNLTFQTVYEAPFVVNGLLCMYKGLMLVGRADDIQAVLDVAGYGFTRIDRQNPQELHRCRTALSIWLHAFTVLAGVTVLLWVVAPWFVASTPGQSLAWAVNYTVQSVCLVACLVCSVWFDCWLMTVCYALSVQFRIASEACAALGTRRGSASDVQAPRSTGNNHRQNANITRNDDDYDELIHHIVDIQKVIKILDDFYAIVRPIAKVQIAVSFFSIITAVFSITRLYLTDNSVLEMFFSVVSLTFQLFMYCYAFDLIETSKSTLNFGLYSCNWTEMSLKFQKTMLLAMLMNTAHKPVIKMSPNIPVNLEMFAKTMILSYRIVSVLLNK